MERLDVRSGRRGKALPITGMCLGSPKGSLIAGSCGPWVRNRRSERRKVPASLAREATEGRMRQAALRSLALEQARETDEASAL